MKYIPGKFELSEADIKEAITYWLNHEVEKRANLGVPYDITFKAERKEGTPPDGAFMGGMADYSVQVVSAVAQKKG